jgi:hypothetical protein
MVTEIHHGELMLKGTEIQENIWEMAYVVGSFGVVRTS